jgi:GNAT superfamily N-acetyltransferase
VAGRVGVKMIGMAGARVLRPFGGAADHALVEALWSAALAPRWPLLPRAIAMVRDGFFAVHRGHPVGCVAVDLAGSIPLVVVAPAHQRRGIGTDLLSAALARLGAADVSVAHAGSGGTDYIWPGVPLDLPAAGRFFAARGWHADHDTVDLVADLRDYRPPTAASERAGRAGVTIAPAAAGDLPAVLAFETATFPSWTRWFRVGNQDILLARDRAGTIVATLLLDGPGADTVFLPMLGPAAATIGYVGVAPQMEGRGIGTALVARASQILRDRGAGACHIGWTVRESFYTRAGYRPWRRYRCSAGPRAVARRRLLPVRNDPQDGESHTSSLGRRPSVRDLVTRAWRRRLLDERAVPPICVPTTACRDAASAAPNGAICMPVRVVSVAPFGWWLPVRGPKWRRGRRCGARCGQCRAGRPLAA